MSMHFFDPFIPLSLEDFDAKVSPSTFNFLILAMGLLLFLNLLIIVAENLLLLDPMLLKGSNQSPINKPLLKSYFLDIDKKKMENVNQGVKRASKHAKLWAKNAFDEWQMFQGFNM
jgi:hypothetical protein